MSAITLLNPYQLFGTPVPAGMSTDEAITYTGLAGWNQRIITPHLFSEGGDPIDVGNMRINVADLPIGEGGARVPTALGAVTSAYKPFQNEEKYASLVEGFEQNGLRCTIMGAYADGRATYAVFDLPDDMRLHGDGGEVHPFIVATDRNDGTGAAKAFTAAVRPTCANMISGLAKKVQVSIRHTRNADPYLLQQVEVLLGLTSEWDRALAREVAALQAQTVTRAQYMGAVVPGVLGERPDEKGRSQSIFDRKFDELAAAWYSPVAAEGDTAWRAYNAVTEWNQHRRTRNERVMAEAVLAGRTAVVDRAVQVLASLA